MKLLFLTYTLFFFDALVTSQCTLNNSSISNVSKLSSSGNVTIDNLIKAEKIKLEKFFNVSVDLKITTGSNGRAIKTCTNCNGTIELGSHLLIQEYSLIGPKTKNSLGKYMIISIMAHEYAHIYQYSHPELKFRDAIVQEVHADMLAGWYMSQYLMNEYGVNREDVKYEFHNANQVKIINDIIQDIGIGFGWLGDEQYWSSQHHGDYMTRAYAFMEAWRCMKGQPVQISCSNFSDWLKDSVWLAEMKVYYDSQH
jgi:hypothetical protein